MTQPKWPPANPGRFNFSGRAEQLQLAEVLDHPRARAMVRVTELPPLRINLVATNGVPLGKDPRSRANDSPEWKDVRRRHYEQVGLWIADTANILIAVMPKNEPAHKIGGTARIVACRRGGRPDSIASEIIASSDVLAPRPELVRSPQQYVWLLDPACGEVHPKLPITVLPPIIEPGATALAYAHPGKNADTVKRKEYLRDSLAAASMIHRLAAIPASAAETECVWPDEKCPANVIEDIRVGQRDVRNGKQRLSRGAFTVLALLFVFTVLAFEVFAKFASETPWVLLIYVALVALMFAVYFWAERRRWQSDAEDFRAVSELLRLQYAWWRAGLSMRVDFVHLQGADQDLGRVREGARNTIVWAQLAAKDRRPSLNWAEVWACSGKSKRRIDWLGSQLEYFKDNERVREKLAQRASIISWVLFITSFCLSVLLFLWLLPMPFQQLVDMEAKAIAACGTATALLWTTIGMGIAGTALWLRDCFRGRRGNWRSGLLSGTVAVVAALGIAWSLRLTGEVLGHLFPVHDGLHDDIGKTYSKYCVIVAIVWLPAIAGALRFRAEKLAYEAEVLSYREALRWFEHADELLTKHPPGSGDSAADERAGSIIERLGKLALAENETWLKTRRERPLTPVIGG